MTELLFTFSSFIILIALMAIGVLLGRKPIAGSCGGLAALSAGKKCSICGAAPPLGDKNSQKLLAAKAVCLGSETNEHLIN